MLQDMNISEICSDFAFIHGEGTNICDKSEHDRLSKTGEFLLNVST